MACPTRDKHTDRTSADYVDRRFMEMSNLEREVLQIIMNTLRRSRQEYVGELDAKLDLARSVYRIKRLIDEEIIGDDGETGNIKEVMRERLREL
jgi:predicted transcriptional regulator